MKQYPRSLFHRYYHTVAGMAFCLLLACAFNVGGQPLSPATQPLGTKVIVDFKSEDVLKNITVNAGVRIARTSDGALEIRISPFAEHNNMWPLVAFGPAFFGEAINLSEYSRLEVPLHQLSVGMSLVDLQLGTSPDGSWNVDNERFVVPGNTTMIGKTSINALRNNDPSEIALIQMVFRPRDIETVFRIEPIRAVYDASAGAPGESLLKKLAAARETFATLKRDLPAKLPADQKQSAAAKIADLDRKLSALSSRAAKARSDQFHKAYRTLSKNSDELTGEIGKLRFLREGPMLVWQPNRYPNFVRKSGPSLRDELLKRVSLSMAGNEFRDVVLMVCAPEQDLSVTLKLHPNGSTPIPADAFEIRQVEYLKDNRGDETGDALIPVTGAISIPAGESRQFWIRFNTRTNSLSPGKYTFDVALHDESRQISKKFPGELIVQDFSLPGYDVLPNNSYAEFMNAHFRSGDDYHQAVRHMKLYGLNYISLHSTEMPKPSGLDDQWKIISCDDTAFKARVHEAVKAWKAAPNDETLNFIFWLGNFEDFGLKKDGYEFGNERWTAVLAQYLEHLKSLARDGGLQPHQWIISVRDESGVPAMKEFDIPFAEAIKRIDPSIRIISNTSTVLDDPDWSARYFRAMDIVQPHLGRTETLEWMKPAGKTMWVYQCDADMPVIGRDIYSYYRVFAWDMLDQGFTGTGVWTYSSHAPTWGEPGQGCLLIYKHPQHGLIHSRRYEIWREGADDFRYVAALRAAAKAKGGAAVKEAETLIQSAVKDIVSNRQDAGRCEHWRSQIAARIMKLRKA